jgi:hypothetical protein
VLRNRIMGKNSLGHYHCTKYHARSECRDHPQPYKQNWKKLSNFS